MDSPCRQGGEYQRHARPAFIGFITRCGNRPLTPDHEKHRFDYATTCGVERVVRSMLPEYCPVWAKLVAKSGQHAGNRNHRKRCAFRPSTNSRGGLPVSSSAEEFQSRADECYRLSLRLRDPEHKSFALFLAAAWGGGAQAREGTDAANGTVPPIAPPAADPQPEDQIE